MVSTMVSAQYLNVKLKDGTYRSFKTSSKTEVSFGDKKGTEPTEFEQTVTVGDYKVTVKLADGTPASDVALHAFIEGDKVKIKAMCWDGYGLECIKDNEVLTPDEALTPIAANGFYTFTVSNISNDVVVTVGYIMVKFDLNNSNITDNFKAKPEDITKMRYGSTIPLTYASAEKHSFRGWYTDKDCTEAWNYSTGVTKSMTLYAKWAEDPTGTQINGHNFVKLGGYYWATENVGYCGDVTAVADPNTTDNGWGFYFYKQAESNALDAAKSLGGTWTLPSVAQWQALIDYCKWTWTTDDKGKNGYLVTGREDTYESDHSIFLPAAGHYFNSDDIVYNQGNSGDYWSADAERYLDFGNGGQGMGYGNPYIGMPVRPVSE